ncbi:MAG: Gfo/Idh/MocA family protein, partial [Candidatus Hodarchaeales archaeon]
MKKVTAVVIGAGNRGKDVYGQYALLNPDEITFVGVAEPNDIRRADFAEKHEIPESNCFTSWEELLNTSKIAEVAFITTQDQLHTAPALKALDLGYKVLLEKPMATKLDECVQLAQKSKNLGLELRIAHVLRYTKFFQTISELINAGKIGDVITIDLRENVSYYHYAHSFVRGNWNNSEKSSPMILAKSCHDLDILFWLVGSRAKTISSFGNLLHFKPENAPVGATQRCLDGCLAVSKCKYYAPRIYIEIIPFLRIASNSHSRKIRLISNIALHHRKLFSLLKKIIPSFKEVENYKGWPVSVITDDLTLSGKWEALKRSNYGKCVYFSDNDVVDHQVVIINFDNGVTATFTMHGFSHDEGRTIRVDGTIGTIIGEFLSTKTKLVFYDHLKGTEDIILDLKAGAGT